MKHGQGTQGAPELPGVSRDQNRWGLVGRHNMKQGTRNQSKTGNTKHGQERMVHRNYRGLAGIGV